MYALLKYVDQCNAELEAAKTAPLGDERLVHLQQAYRFAWLAVQERAKHSNIAPWQFGRRNVRRRTSLLASGL